MQQALSGLSLAEVLECVARVEADAGRADVPFSIAFLRNCTIEGIEPYLKYHCYQAGLHSRLAFGGYNIIRQELLDPASFLHASQPDLIVLTLIVDQLAADYDHPGWRADGALAELDALQQALLLNTSAILAVNTFMPPFESDYGIAAPPDGRDRYHEVVRLNRHVREFAARHPSRVILIDWERLVRILGEEESMDYRFWYMAKAPFKKAFLELYACELAKIAKALKGKSKKCLVLDCDNTLWGGIVGEDGSSGIKLDPNDYPGNIFYDFQQTVLHLHRRGVLITLCSKNNPDDVWEVLDNHPGSLLNRSHFAGWRVNWEDKVTNIRSLAVELNLGLDSLVFVDDNPAECELVRTLLPEVEVIQVPAQLYRYPRLLLQLGLFDTLTFSEEDRQRTRMYQDEASRNQAAASFDTIDDYLASLAIHATIHAAKPHEIPRIAQLTQKTNQFNLTTRRYAEAAISEFVQSADWAVFSLSVRDKFGDSGLTGVLIARRAGTTGIIDSLLLSCRVLGKKLEICFFTQCLQQLAVQWGATEWQAEYIATAKNQQTADFWPRMLFTEFARKDGVVRYVSQTAKIQQEQIPFITIEE